MTLTTLDLPPDQVPDRLVRMTQPSIGLLRQMIEQNDEKHEDGHHRLRTDLRAVEHRLDQLNDKLIALTLTTERRSATPVDLAKVTLTPRLAAVVLGVFASTFGAMWAATYSLRSDVRDLLTTTSLQAETTRASFKLQDERMSTLRESVDAMKRRVELQQYEVQRLNETMQAIKGAKPK